jgi:hypothetical protein
MPGAQKDGKRGSEARFSVLRRLPVLASGDRLAGAGYPISASTFCGAALASWRTAVAD